MTTAQFDVGGYRLCAEVTGDGSPVVVFSSGLGDGGEAWQATIAALGRELSTITYARAGIGESDSLADRAPRSLGSAADELQRLLAAIGETRPCVLVGHSIGALVALIFASRWPETLAGLVLVDPTDIHLTSDFEGQEPFLEDGERDDQVPLDVIGSVAEVTAARRRLDMPGVVISSRVGRWLDIEDGTPWQPLSLQDMDERWQRAHQALAEDLGAPRLVADVGDHYVQNDQPELVAEAIRSIALAD